MSHRTGKGTSSTQKCFWRGYISSQEGTKFCKVSALQFFEGFWQKKNCGETIDCGMFSGLRDAYFMIIHYSLLIFKAFEAWWNIIILPEPYIFRGPVFQGNNFCGMSQHVDLGPSLHLRMATNHAAMLLYHRWEPPMWLRDQSWL